METKTCSKCNKTKSLDFFTLRSDRKYYDTRCKDCVNSYNRKYRVYNPLHNMFHGSKLRAKKKGIEFSISKEYLESIWPKDNLCPALKIPLTSEGEKGRRTRFSPSLDRIDNSKGYIEGNIQIISWQANTMKSNATEDQLKSFANWILMKF